MIEISRIECCANCESCKPVGGKHGTYFYICTMPLEVYKKLPEMMDDDKGHCEMFTERKENDRD